ncbi:MAG: hypothetical protein JO131_06170, partial [Gammaproteobacteria bacterium]|nr:hypothetical protein [Gammaproteobacteria bacterium]
PVNKPKQHTTETQNTSTQKTDNKDLVDSSIELSSVTFATMYKKHTSGSQDISNSENVSNSRDNVKRPGK